MKFENTTEEIIKLNSEYSYVVVTTNIAVEAFNKAETAADKLHNGLKNVGEESTGVFERLTHQDEEL